MERGRRIPLHDHSGLNSGGRLTLTVPQTVSEAAGGSDVAFAAPVAVGTALAQGDSAAAAAANHVHTNTYLGTVAVSGTAVAGYVLTADDADSASWQSAAGTAAASVVWYDEGVAAGTAGIVNLVGSSGTVAVAGGTATITLSAGTAGGGGSVVFYDEGVAAGTAAIINVTGAGGTVSVSGGTAIIDISSGGGSDLVQVASGYGSIRIPGIAVADVPPASPNGSDDEFDTTDTSAPFTGWTTLQTPTTANTNSTFRSHLYLKRNAGNASTDHVGIYKAWSPSAGNTVTAKVSDAVHSATNFQRGGQLFVGEATPGKMIFMTYVNNGAGPLLAVIYYTAPGTFSSTLISVGAGWAAGGGGPFYFRIQWNSSTSITYLVSKNGLLYSPVLAAHNPGFTVGSAGLATDPANATYNGEAAFDFIRFNWTPGT